MNKYRNVKVEYKGITFDSKRERDYFMILKDREKKGEIHDLKLQVPFELVPAYEINGRKVRPIIYVADFTYMERLKSDIPSSQEVIADVKPSKDYQTEVYKLKKKLFEYKYHVEIKELY